MTLAHPPTIGQGGMVPHHTPLIATICAALVLAFVMAAIAQRLRISALVGYLLAGIAIGPFTPGFVADQALANELAEIGVILLMFGVGLHFSVKDLMSVRAIALPGAVVQICVATVMGAGLAWLLGWTLEAGLVFGLALSVASTVVLLRALQLRGLVETERGRIAVGWLIVEDLAMVLALVLLPALAGADAGAQGLAAQLGLGLAGAVVVTLGKVAAFVALMLVVGRKLVPALLHWVAHTGSRELFRLSVLATALGIAYGAAELFGVSFALGAFFAGMILSESALSQRAAEEALPLRDAFAVLFFVSVGMLFDPSTLITQPAAVLATVLIIVLGKSIAAYGIVRLFRHDTGTALTISASLAQIGEFSFILAGLGVSLGLLPEAGRSLVLAGAILSIMLNPLAFALIARMYPAALAPPPPQRPAAPRYAVLVGYGRVGRRVAEGLKTARRAFLVVETDNGRAAAAREAGFDVLTGNAAASEVLDQVRLDEATGLLVAIPDPFEAGQVVAQARALNPALDIVARAHEDADVEHLLAHGANLAVMGEAEIARAMLLRAGRWS